MRAIYRGELDTQSKAVIWLDEHSIPFSSTESYKCVLVEFENFRLCYRPDGVLSRSTWKPRPDVRKWDLLF